MAEKNYLDAVRAGWPSIRQQIIEGSIIKNGDFFYLCTGFYHKRAKDMGAKEGESISVGDMYYLVYDAKSVDYVYVKAVVKYEKMWYFIPSTFSWEANLDLSSSWKATSKTEIVCKKLSYRIDFLSIDICKKYFPGYLD